MKAIGLGIACVVLVAALFGTVFYYNNYVGNHTYSNDQYNELKEWLSANMTLLQNQLETLNSSYQKYVETYNRTNSEYLDLQSQNDNLTDYFNSLLNNYNSLIANYNQLNASYQSLQSDLNQTTEMLAEKDTAFSQLQNEYSDLSTWVGALLSPPANHTAVAALVNASYPIHILTNKFLFSSAIEDGTESDWALLWIQGNVVDAAAFMSIIITSSNLTSIEFSRCDLTGGDSLSVNISGTMTGQFGPLAGFYSDIFNSTDALKGYIDLQGS